ncbi:MAG: site-2 protease family protein [Candidatus Aenigmarchaeota archaeon]|nr:site-2 protease family protein [Candidatus Aenigmarchaeota archaeon]
MIDLYTASVVAFFAFLGVIIYRDRKNIEFKYVLLMRKTKRFSKLLDDVAKKSIGFWKIVGTLAFIVCLFFMIYGAWNMVNVAYLVYSGAIDQPALSIALPIPSDQMTVGPGFIGIPFWFWIIAIAIILVPHEAMHGIIARSEKIKLKDVGLMLLAIFPGAFVEPDEKQLKKSKLMTRLRIFSAGSFINISIGVLVLLLVQSFLWAPNVSGILITGVNETSPAGQLGLEPGMVIEKIGSIDSTMTFNDYAFLALTEEKSNSESITKTMAGYIIIGSLSSYAPGDTVEIIVDGETIELELEQHPAVTDFAYPYIGIESKVYANDYGMFLVIFPLLGMIASLSVLVGIFNILPIYPLDGGLIVQALAEKISKKRGQQITLAITIAMVAVIAFTFVGPLFI